MTTEEAFAAAAAEARAGRLDQAANLYRQVLSANPRQAEAHFYLANLLARSGRADEAIAAYRSAIESRPVFSEAMNNLSVLLRRVGKTEEALDLARWAVTLDPTSAENRANFAATLQQAGQLEEALESWRQATECRADFPEAWNGLGMAMREAGRLDEAELAFRTALDRRKNDPDILYNLGNTLAYKRQWEQAIATYREVLAIRPSHEMAWNNLQWALGNLGRRPEATAACREAVARLPESARAQVNLGMALLAQGELAEGWEHFQWHTRLAGVAKRDFGKPQWGGVAGQGLVDGLAGQRVLLHEEQGFGDQLQFARYAPLLADLGIRVILESPRALERLHRTLRGVDALVVQDEALPEFDFQILMPDLPRAMGTTLATIPHNVPYLFADTEITQRWAGRLEGIGGLKVGINWAGNRKHRLDDVRSTTLSDLSPLADVSGVRFISLQKSAAPPEPGSPRLTFMDWTADLTDFAETAALMGNLDLIITIDSAVAHLAGALGRPTWLLLPFACDWRWLVDRDDSPWYPTMRLFRQQSFGDWSGPVMRAAAELQSLAAINRSRG
jgi:tetratricopeptide (TPR) repeat protein